MKNYNLNINTKISERLTINIYSHIFIVLFFITTLFISSCDFNSPVTNFGTKIKSEVIWNIDIETLEKINIISEKQFDKNGQIIKVVNYGQNGNKIDESSFIYDNNKSKETKITFNSDGKELVQDFSYTFNENGRVEQKILILGNDTTNKQIINYTYDELGNIIKIKETNIIKSLEVKTTESELTYNYSQNGNISEIIYNNPSSNNKIFRDSLVYDKKANSLKMYQIDKENTLVSAVLYNYNSLGNVIFTSFFDKNSNIFMKQSHIYTYH